MANYPSISFLSGAPPHVVENKDKFCKTGIVMIVASILLSYDQILNNLSYVSQLNAVSSSNTFQKCTQLN